MLERSSKKQRIYENHIFLLQNRIIESGFVKKFKMVATLLLMYNIEFMFEFSVWNAIKFKFILTQAKWSVSLWLRSRMQYLQKLFKMADVHC